MLQTNNVHHLKEVRSAARLGAEPDSLRALFRKQPAECLSAGQSLFFEGDMAKHLFEVVGGSLRIFKIISDGRRVITGFAHVGDIVGVSLKSHYLYSAEAIVDTRIRRLSRRAFEAEITRCPDLQSKMFSHLCDEMAAVQDQMVLLSRKSAEERVCTFLRKQVESGSAFPGSSALVELPMTRLDIADYLGLTIETVSRTMTRLARRGIVCPVDRHTVRVMKYGVLVQLSGDDEYYGDEPIQIPYAGGNHH